MSICVDESVDVGRSYQGPSSISIEGCYFRRTLVYSGSLSSGGVIFVDSAGHSLVIMNTMFFNCRVASNGNGGGIYFRSLEAHLRNICACKCSGNACHFASISVNSTKYNRVEFLSMLLCPDNKVGDSPIYLDYGDLIFSNSNSSSNIVQLFSGAFLNNPTSTQSKYCSYSSNYAEIENCIYLSYTNGAMEYTNVVNNTSPSGTGVLYIWDGTTNISNCIFMNNSDTLFFADDGHLRIQNCYIYHFGIESKTSGTGSIIFDDNINRNLTNTIVISHFASFHCQTIHHIPTEDSSIFILPYRTFDEQCTFHVRNKMSFMLIFTIIPFFV